MADNLTTAAGTVGTDDISGVHYQRVKVAGGADGTAIDMVGTAERGLYVDPRLSQLRVKVTPTISTSAYASGDCIGGLMTITGAARVNGGSGVLNAFTVLDKTQAQRSPMDLMFFDESVTAAGDNAAVAFTDADMDKCIAILSLPFYNNAFPGTPLNSHASSYGIGLPFVCGAASTSIFCQAVARGTPTYTSTSDLTFAFTVLQD